jgi:hypothetical protein
MKTPPAPTSEAFKTIITEFVDFLLGDERTSFTFAEAEELAADLGYSLPTAVIHALKAAGLDMEERGVARRIRTISSNSNDRWYGPGSCPTHGGSGWEQISGFAGDKG